MVQVCGVGPGQAVRVLTQVLVPRFHDEELDELVRALTVAEETPLSGAGAKPREAHADHRLLEGVLAFR